MGGEKEHPFRQITRQGSTGAAPRACAVPMAVYCARWRSLRG